MQNLEFAVSNLSLALTMIAVMAAAAAIIRAAVAREDDPLGPAVALGLSAGGFALTVLVFLALGLRGAPVSPSSDSWWLLPSIAWLALVSIAVFAAGRQPVFLNPSGNGTLDLCATLAVLAGGLILVATVLPRIVENPRQTLVPAVVGLLLLVVEAVLVARALPARPPERSGFFHSVSPLVLGAGALVAALLLIWVALIVVQGGRFSPTYAARAHSLLPVLRAAFGVLHVLAAAAVFGLILGWSARLLVAGSAGGWRVAPALILLVWVLTFNLLQCFQPRFQADALWYHLTLPFYWFRHGGLIAHPTLTEAGYPLLTEMLYTLPVSRAQPFAARVLHLAFGLGVVLAIYGDLRSRLSAAGALAVAAAFFVFDSVNEAAAWANIDLARTFFLVGAAACLARYADRNERRDLVVGAVLSGLAMSTAYIAIAFGNGLLTIALVAATAGSRAPARRILRDVALFWAISAAVFSPWLLKNLVHYGNPLHGLPGSNFRIPAPALISDYYLGNVFFIGSAIMACWFLLRAWAGKDEWFLAVYLLGYLFAGVFFLPAAHLRFFFPVYAVGLMLIGRATAPLLDRWRWLEPAIPAALLVFMITVIGYGWYQGLFAEAADFLFHDAPPHWKIIWHQ